MKTVIIILGPTAVGKTSAAIKLAEHFQTEIISADSRQCFKELNIGVARPSQKQLKMVKHHFIASHSIQENVSAGIFARYALEKTKELFQHHDVDGMDEIPEVPSDIRRQFVAQYEKNGIQWLQQQIEVKDPKFFQQGEIQNPQRLLRALEVIESTGKSILEFHKHEKRQRDFNIVKIGLELSKEELHRNIDARVANMVEEGLVDEVKKLLPYKNLNALQTVGYAEIFDYFEGQVSLDRAVDLIKRNTRQYAKRQMTWFKKDKTITWTNPANEIIIELAESVKHKMVN
jgi:tRNA dimethylallyltransferase